MISELARITEHKENREKKCFFFFRESGLNLTNRLLQERNDIRHCDAKTSCEKTFHL